MPEMSQLAAKKAAGPPQFSFVMNVGRLLQQNPEFHNSWLVIPIPDPEVEALPKCPPVIQAASHIRAAIVDARRPAPVRQIIDQHSNVRSSPLGPVDWGCREPNVVVSSWTNIPLYNLDFVSGDGNHSKPVYVQVGIKVCPMLKAAGLAFADGILTWIGEEGYWVQGCLRQGAWDRISDFRSFDEPN
jgi:hypothetical protein